MDPLEYDEPPSRSADPLRPCGASGTSLADVLSAINAIDDSGGWEAEEPTAIESNEAGPVFERFENGKGAYVWPESEQG